MPRQSSPRSVCFVTAVAISISATALPLAAQTMVPKLDQEGRKGEMARHAKEQAVARFDAVDTDKDGRLSREEIARGSQYLSDNFDARDSNKDGFLSWDEYVGHNRWPKEM